MRTVISILLIAVLLLNLFGFYVAFMVNQKEIQKEVTKSIVNNRSSNLSLLTLSKQEFENIKWLRKGKEFQLNGKLFDVSGIEILGNYVKLYVLEDILENDLIENFVSLVRQESEKDQSNSPLKTLLEHFLKEFTADTFLTTHYPSVTCFILSQQTGSCYSSYISNQPSPPPDFFFTKDV